MSKYVLNDRPDGEGRQIGSYRRALEASIDDLRDALEYYDCIGVSSMSMTWRTEVRSLWKQEELIQTLLRNTSKSHKPSKSPDYIIEGVLYVWTRID